MKTKSNKNKSIKYKGNSGLFFYIKPYGVQQIIYFDTDSLKRNFPDKFAQLKNDSVIMHYYYTKTMYDIIIRTKDEFNKILAHMKKNSAVFSYKCSTSSLVNHASKIMYKTYFKNYTSEWFDRAKNNFMNEIDRIK